LPARGRVLEAVDIQGVRPLAADEVAALQKRDAVARRVLGLTTSPDPASPETAEIRAFYVAWRGCNGAFAKLIRAEHAAFFRWLDS
jgi:hypothetical protein